jgi:hypothetical protein
VRILFAALHNGYYRNLDSVVEELARRGHEIHLGAEREDSSFGGQPIVDRSDRRLRQCQLGLHGGSRSESLFLSSKIRFAIDYLRISSPHMDLVRLWRRARGAHTDRNASPLEIAALAWRPISGSRARPRRRRPGRA